MDGQIAWESSLDRYVATLAHVFMELLSVTVNTGVCFIVIGDTYHARLMPLVRQRTAPATVDCGRALRHGIIWERSEAASGIGRDGWRFTHEHILFLYKWPQEYTFNANAIRVQYSGRTLKRLGRDQACGGPNAQPIADPTGPCFASGKSFRLNPAGILVPDVLCHPTASSPLKHYDIFPLEFVERIVLTATQQQDLVIRPFAGTSTTGVIVLRNGREFFKFEVSPSYHKFRVRRHTKYSEVINNTSLRG